MGLPLSAGWTSTPAASFLCMLVRPRLAIARIVAQRPSFGSLVLFLTCISLLRGVLDAVLVLLDDGQLFSIWAAGRLLPWLVGKAYPLLLADWLAVYVRWLGFALVPYLLGRFCGGAGRLSDFLRLYGVILGIYVVTVLPNFAYFFMPLPLLRFEAAPFFRPTLGVGNLLTSAWLAWVTYTVVRALHRLPRFEAAAIGLLTPLLNIAALVLPGAVLFNLSALFRWTPSSVTSVTLLGFSAVSLGLIAGALSLSRWLHRREQLRLAEHGALQDPATAGLSEPLDCSIT